ncbi:MAG TPA: hypothetical protein VHA78_05145 [Candidatus Peribacteraceae bacterium]|nr:hypothetical protein [Candidatus Peribacteraceae bacterium]
MPIEQPDYGKQSELPTSHERVHERDIDAELRSMIDSAKKRTGRVRGHEREEENEKRNKLTSIERKIDEPDSPKNPYAIISRLNKRKEREGSRSRYDYSTDGVHLLIDPQQREAIIDTLRAMGVTKIVEKEGGIIFQPTKDWWNLTIRLNYEADHPDDREVDGSVLMVMGKDGYLRDPRSSANNSAPDRKQFNPRLEDLKPTITDKGFDLPINLDELKRSDKGFNLDKPNKPKSKRTGKLGNGRGEEFSPNISRNNEKYTGQDQIRQSAASPLQRLWRMFLGR